MNVQPYHWDSEKVKWHSVKGGALWSSVKAQGCRAEARRGRAPSPALSDRWFTPRIWGREPVFSSGWTLLCRCYCAALRGNCSFQSTSKAPGHKYHEDRGLQALIYQVTSWGCFLKKKIFFIETQLVYDIIWITGIQYSDSQFLKVLFHL